MSDSTAATATTKKTFGASVGLAWVLILGGIVGWAGAFALTLERLHVAANPNATLSCDLASFISCKSVMLSHQAKLFGFPNPLIGLSAFMFPIAVGVAVLAGAKFARWFWNTFMVGISLGFIFIVWLAHEAIFEIGALCPYCMVAWAGMIPMFWHLLVYLCAEDIIPVPIKTIGFFERIRSWAWVFTLLTEVALIAIMAVKFWAQWAKLFGIH
ncbi:MAG: hypothetical protein RL670_606 [Actinomycetota bacterium]